VRVPRKKITELVAFAATAQGVALAEVDIAVVGEGEIESLNRRYLRHAGPTDVLSFDMSDAPAAGISAQLVICGDVAARQAKAHNVPIEREILLYVLHGLLHLMGYEDESVRGAAKMHAREDEILDEFHRMLRRN